MAQKGQNRRLLTLFWLRRDSKNYSRWSEAVLMADVWSDRLVRVGHFSCLASLLDRVSPELAAIPSYHIAPGARQSGKGASPPGRPGWQGRSSRARAPPRKGPPRRPTVAPAAGSAPPGRLWRVCACAVASERLDRDGGRFRVAAARRGAGRSRRAVDRAQHPEFGGNSADTPSSLPGMCFPRGMMLQSLLPACPG